MNLNLSDSFGHELAIDGDARAEQRTLLWRLRIEKAARLAKRVSSRPDLSVFGCYDAGNVGDLALGQTLFALANRVARPVLDSPRQVRGLLPPRAVVLGGGGVITARAGAPLEAFTAYVRRRPCSVAVVGVSSTVSESELSDPALRLLQEAAWISCRSTRSAGQLKAILGRSDIVVQPDIAFGLRRGVSDVELPARRAKRLVINVSPFLHSKRGRAFVSHTTPSAWFSQHLPDQAAWYDKIGPRYVSLVRALVAKFVERGWEVVTVALAPEDAEFARALLRDQRVEHLPYTSSPLRAVAQFATAERALVTRFHAHVFAALARTPFGSFAYSPKCADLFQDLNLPAVAQARPQDWVHDLSRTIERLCDDSAIAVFAEAQLVELERQAHDLSRRGVLAALDGS